MKTLTEAEIKKVWEFIYKAQSSGSHYTGMSYEQGMEAVMDVLEGNSTVDEITE